MWIHLCGLIFWGWLCLSQIGCAGCVWGLYRCYRPGRVGGGVDGLVRGRGRGFGSFVGWYRFVG